jgi:hypothetical protein
MQLRTRRLIVAIIQPPLRAVGFVFSLIHKMFFSWWLDPWMQRRKTQTLWEDVEANLHFLYSAGQPAKEQHPQILPFDYASIRIIFQNIIFCITRGRGEINVTLSPAQAPKETYELAIVMAALESGDVREQKPVQYLSDVGDLLRPRLEALNKAFSQQSYPDFRVKLIEGKQTVRVLTRQLEWELTKRLYPRG